MMEMMTSQIVVMEYFNTNYRSCFIAISGQKMEAVGDLAISLDQHSIVLEEVMRSQEDMHSLLLCPKGRE